MWYNFQLDPGTQYYQ